MSRNIDQMYANLNKLDINEKRLIDLERYHYVALYYVQYRSVLDDQILHIYVNTIQWKHSKPIIVSLTIAGRLNTWTALSIISNEIWFPVNLQRYETIFVWQDIAILLGSHYETHWKIENHCSYTWTSWFRCVCSTLRRTSIFQPGQLVGGEVTRPRGTCLQ